MQISFTSDNITIHSYNMICDFIKKLQKDNQLYGATSVVRQFIGKRGIAVLRQYEAFSSQCSSAVCCLALHLSSTPRWELCVDLEMKWQTETSLIVLITGLYALCRWVYLLKCVFNSQTDMEEISTFINKQKSKQIQKYIATFLNLQQLSALGFRVCVCDFRCLYFGDSSFRQLTHT